MGGHYWSLALPGADAGSVDETLRHWLGARGLEEVVPQQPLDLQEDCERAYLLFGDDRWTIVLFSHLDEMERLRFELRQLEVPLLSLWMHDSSIWGYELADGGSVVSAFHSNPRYFGPEEPAEGPNDTDALIARCGLQGVETAAVLRLQRQRQTFADGTVEAFATLIGAGPAASQYGYLAAGEVASGQLEGFSSLHRRFRRLGHDPMRGFDLHAVSCHPEPLPDPASAGATPLPPSLRILTTFARLISPVLRLLLRLFVGWRRFRSPNPPPSPPAAGETAILPARLEGEWLVNPDRRCRIRLVPGIEISTAPPHSILPFSVGDHAVHSRTENGEAARWIVSGPRGSSVEADGRFHVGPLPARYQRFSFPRPRNRILTTYRIQSPDAVFAFSLHSDEPLDEETERAFREAVASFECLEV